MPVNSTAAAYLQCMATNLADRVTTYSATMLSIFRIVIGLLLVCHGTSKLFGWPGGPSVEVLSWPYWWAGLIELVVGVLVTIGLFTREAAFIGSGHMAVAYFWQHFPDDFWPINNGGEPAVLFCFALLLLVFTGPGSLAVSRR
ncbi:membrane protein [Mycolicibacterium confluentis]|uniref:Membrane protein n=2 Tax=Mycolicibacterium confluentis TaxID=28047 RepID=A0A7I7XVF7_9MYCO|nr:membrane protein [Mycolicibacterium confluentis]